MFVSRGQWSWAYLSANLLLFLLFLPLLVPLHELAHAAGAWLMRGTVFALYFGYGWGMRERRIGQVTVAAQPLPLIGLCVAGFQDHKRTAGRTAVYIAAPLLMHAVIVLALLPGCEFNRLGTAVAWREVFVLVNAVVLIQNLIPRQAAMAPTPLNSDGMGLWRLSRRLVKTEDLHTAYFLFSMLYAYRAGDYERTVQATRTGLAIYPDQPFLRNGLASGLIALKDYEKALPILHELLAAGEGISSDVRALALNNLAFVALEQEVSSPELDQALDYAREAYHLVPWMAELRGTLGAVLVEWDR